AAIDHRAEPKLGKALRAACPDGIDVHFENVGGAHLEAAIANIAVGARIVFCGAVGDYDRAEGPVPVRGLANLVMRRGRLEGYIVTDHVKRYPEAIAAMSRLIAEGRLKYAVETHDGVETAYAALTGLLAGANTGKTIVKFADP
ncbi:MAG: zinc-binding dehydrogenase, partial [Pseudomonadota bacterium]